MDFNTLPPWETSRDRKRDTHLDRRHCDTGHLRSTESERPVSVRRKVEYHQGPETDPKGRGVTLTFEIIPSFDPGSITSGVSKRRTTRSNEE